MNIWYMVDSFLLLVCVLLMDSGYFDWFLFMMSLMMMMLVLMYYVLCKSVGLGKMYKYGDYSSDSMLVKFLGDVNVTEESKMTLSFMSMNMCKLKKYNKSLYLLVNDLLFVMFLLVPWNWFSCLLSWLVMKMHKLMVMVNSNKDIYYKKSGVNSVSKNLTLTEWKYYYMVEWVLIFPMMSLMMLPSWVSMKMMLYWVMMDLYSFSHMMYMYSMLSFLLALSMSDKTKFLMLNFSNKLNYFLYYM